ncbi:MAG: hypothetical protein AAF998_06895 [Bacteroidota bacterium]
MNEKLEFKKRIGPDPHTLPEVIEAGGSAALEGCPDLWELENGDFVVIGIRKTGELKGKLPESAGCGPDEEIVIVPRYIFTNAKQEIPDH